jgi:hypothetical protein
VIVVVGQRPHSQGAVSAPASTRQSIHRHHSIAFTLRSSIALACLATVFVANDRALSAQSAAQGRQAGLLSGQVVAAFDSSPLAKVTVTLSGLSVDLPRTTSTNDNGEYEFVNIPPGSYTLTATLDGYYTTKYGESRPGQVGRWIDLASGEMLKRLDFALLRGAAISGRVIDRFGRPYAGAIVGAHRLNGASPSTPRFETGTAYYVRSDGLGGFRLSNLLPGSYAVVASADETWEDGRAEDGRNSYRPSPFGEAIALDAGDERQNIDIRLAAAGRTKQFTGLVQSASGAPASGATVRILRGAAWNAATDPLGEVDSISSDKDGQFKTGILPDDAYRVEASVPSGAVKRQRLEDNGANLVVLGSPHEVSGTIRVAPGSELPILLSRLEVAAIGADATRNRTSIYDGRFSWRQLEGRFLFRVDGLPHNWMVASVTLDGRDITDLPYEIRSDGGTTRGLEIVVAPGAASITGDVVDPHGAPLANGTVIAFAVDARRRTPGSRFEKWVRPDEDGYFVIDGLPGGEYYVVGSEDAIEADRSAPDFYDRLVPKASRLDLAANAAQNISIAVDYEK